jgi:hypothetical protein
MRRVVSKCAEFTEDLTRDFRGSDEDWIQRRQKELQQDRQSWRESLNFQPESLNGSGAARQASLGEKIKEGFDKVWTACSIACCSPCRACAALITAPHSYA